MNPKEYKIIIGRNFKNERFNRARKARENADKSLRENKINLEQFIEDLFQKEPKGSFFDVKNFLCYNIYRKK